MGLPTERKDAMLAAAGRGPGRTTSQPSDGLGQGIAALFGGAAIAVAGAQSGASPEDIADTIGEFAGGRVDRPTGRGRRWVPVDRAGPNQHRRRFHQRPGVSNSWLSVPRQRAELGSELVRVERRFREARLRPAGGGRVVRDCQRIVVNAEANQHPAPGNQLGMR